MENIKKFDKKSFIMGVVLMGVVMLIVVFFMYTRMQEIHQMVPKITYDKNGKGWLDYRDWLGWTNITDRTSKDYLSYVVRAFDINKVKPFDIGYGFVENQVTLNTIDNNYRLKIITRNELYKKIKDNIDIDFTILNLENESSNWYIDFDSDIAPISELKKIDGLAIVVKREIILPKYYNKYKIGKAKIETPSLR